MLTYWVKERGVMDLSEAVRRMTTDTADKLGLVDRDRIAGGLRADLNIIDMDTLAFRPPYVTYDLPIGGQVSNPGSTVQPGVWARRNERMPF
jgi:N-acyl-D-aspartate/D-glutamate deacylase